MNKNYLNQFVRQIEELAEACSSEESVRDEAGAYPKAAYLHRLAADAKELIKRCGMPPSECSQLPVRRNK